MSPMSDLLVRPSQLDDFEDVDRLFARSYPVLLRPHYKPSVYVSAMPIIARARPELLDSDTFFVAEDSQGDIIGAGGWSLQRPDGGQGSHGIGHVRHVVTDHRRVRRGVGRALLSHIKLHAKGSGIAILRSQSTLNAVPFYENQGFEVLGDVSVILPGDIEFPAVLMECRL